MPTPAGIEIPPEMMRRLRFRARSHHRTLETEIMRCISNGLAQEERPERFRDRARKLRQSVHGVLTADALQALINNGRS